MANTITVTNNTAEEVSFGAQGLRLTIAAGATASGVPAKYKQTIIDIVGGADIDVSDANDGAAGAQGPAGPQGPAGADGADAVLPVMAFQADSTATTIAGLKDDHNALIAKLIAAGLMAAS